MAGAITETIDVDAGPAIAGLNEFTSALEKAAAKYAELEAKMSKGLGGGASAAGADKMAAAMDKAAASIDAAVGKINAAMDKVGGSADAAASGLGRLDEAAATAESSLSAAAVGADEAAGASDRLAASADAAGAALDRQALAGTRAGESSAKAAESGGGFWKGLGTVMLGAGVAAAYGIDKAMKFQAQMLLLHTQAGVSVKDTATMSKGVLLISTQTGQSLSSVAESAYHVASNMASMGTSTTKQLQVVKIAAEGAAVGHSNLVDTTNALTSVVASGIPGVKTYSQAMGMLNATVGSGDMSMQQLAESMASGVVPIVKGYGLNLKDVGAALATFGDLNIRGANAGTDLRTSVQALSKPAASAKAEMAALGLTSTTLAKDMQQGGLIKALDDLTGRFQKAGLTGKTEGGAITDLFGKKAGPGLSVLLENMDRLHSKYPMLTQDANNFDKAWQATQQSPAQKWKEAVAGLQASAVGFGTQLLPAFNSALGVVDKILAAINGSKGGARDMALAFGGIAALFTGNKLASGIKSAFQTGESVLRGVGKVSQVLNIPGLSKLANIGSGGAAGGMEAAARTQAEAAATMLDAARIQAEAAGTSVKGSEAGAAGGGASKAGSALGAALMTAAGSWLLGHGVGHFMGAPTKQDTKAYQSDVPGWLQAPANFVFGGKAASAYRDAGNAPSWVKMLLGGALGTPAAKGSNWENWYHNIFGGSGGAVGNSEVPGRPPPGRQQGAIPEAWGKVASIGSALGGGAAVSAVSSLPGKIVGALSSLPGKLSSIGSSAMSGLAHALGSGSGGAASAVSSLAGKIGGALGSLPGKLTSAGSSAVAGLAHGLSSGAGAAVSAVSSLAGKISSTFASLPGKLASIGAAAVAGLAHGIEAGAGAAIGAAEHVAGAVVGALKSVLHIFSPSKVTQKIGAQTVDGLVIGLEGGQSAVTAAAQALGKQVAKAADVTAIDNAITKGIGYAGKDSALVKYLKTDQGKLLSLSAQRTKLEAEIGDAQQISQSAISSASIMTAGQATPYDPMSVISSYQTVQGMQYQAQQQAMFAQQVGQLKKMGLNSTSLNQIVQGGAASGLPVAQGITSGGKSAVTQLNALQAQIRASAAKLGNEGAGPMYQAGVSAGQGLASGLKSQLGAVDAAIKQLADSMVATIKKALKSHSPSLVFAEVGLSIPQGVAQGVDAGSAVAQAAVGRMGSRLSGAHPGITYGHDGASAGGHGGGQGGHTTINVTVMGSVTSETDLLTKLQGLQLKRANSNWQGGWKLPGRAV